MDHQVTLLTIIILRELFAMFPDLDISKSLPDVAKEKNSTNFEGLGNKYRKVYSLQFLLCKGATNWHNRCSRDHLHVDGWMACSTETSASDIILMNFQRQQA